MGSLAGGLAVARIIGIQRTIHHAAAHGISVALPIDLIFDDTDVLVRLDAAVMLAVVFTFEAPDGALGRAALDRLLEVNSRLSSVLRESPH